MQAAWIILAAAVLLLGQTSAKKEDALTTKMAVALPRKPDTLARSKQCTIGGKVCVDVVQTS
jgi:hypothetical protein